jgi:ribosomal protein S18 acetylase RimI-like enzyme
MPGPTITRGSIGDVESLEPLWVEVHRHHAASMPELAPYVTDAETWAERSALYRELLGKPDTRLLLARLDGALAGYGLSHVLDVADTWVPDTWRTGARIVELESLAVRPAWRGTGIGSALLDALEREWSALGVDDAVVGALAGNADAIRLYERRGYRPTWLYLSRFAGRDGAPAPPSRPPR